MKRYFPLLLSLFLLISCGKDDGDAQLQFRAEVLSQGPDCQAFLIRFLEDIETVSQITGSLSDTYHAGSLPPGLETPGTVIRLNFRTPVGNEDAICTAPLPSFPLIIVINAATE